MGLMLLALLEELPRYSYQIVKELCARSDEVLLVSWFGRWVFDIDVALCQPDSSDTAFHYVQVATWSTMSL